MARRASDSSTEITWTTEAAEKGGYEHFMLKEMHEQPQALRAAIAGRLTRDNRIRVDELESVADAIVAARPGGAGGVRQRVLRRRWSGPRSLQSLAGIPARANVGSEFRYSPPPLDEKTLVIAVTQSGETADTIAPTRLAREQGCAVIAVTNTVGSAITRESDAVLFLQAGPEVAVAASKTFVTQVTTLAILAAAIAKLRGRLSREDERALAQGLRALPDQAARAPRARRAARQRSRVDT